MLLTFITEIIVLKLKVLKKQFEIQKTTMFSRIINLCGIRVQFPTRGVQ